MCRIEWFVKELGITTDLSNLERAKLKRMDTLATLEKYIEAFDKTALAEAKE